MKRRAGTEVWFGREAHDLPNRKLGLVAHDIFASFSGPDTGLALVEERESRFGRAQDADGQ